MAEIIWTEPALDDLDAIAGYIALDKPGAAKRIVRKIFSRIELIAVFPKSGGKPRDLIGTPYRQVVVSPVKVFYRIGGDRIYVIYVMRGEQQFRFRDLTDREK